MVEVEEALAQFTAGDLDEDALLTVLQEVVKTQPESVAQAETIILQLQKNQNLSDATATKLLAPLQASPHNLAATIATATSDTDSTTPHAHVGMLIRDRFTLLEEIGRGGMGVVYRARDRRREEADDRNSEVAIKVMARSLQDHPDAMITLQREARRAQQLAHPNIATVYDFDRVGDVAYLCMELLKGKPLDEVMNEPGTLSKETAVAIINGMSSGLAYAHERGIVHADLKPGNVFLTNDNTVKILDFGVARTVARPDQSTGTETRFDAGRWHAMTPAYASCEMFEHAEPDPRDDIYALACVSYELLEGRHPYGGMPAPQARDAGLNAKAIRGLTRRQNKTMQEGLAFEREDRIGSAEAFRSGLTEVESAPVLTKVSMATLATLTTLGLVWLFVSSDASGPDLTNPTPTSVADPFSVSDPAIENRSGSETNSKPTAAEPPAEVDLETQQKIERILEVADLHFAMGRVVSPDGSNAAEAYIAVAQLQPGNVAARDGIERINRNLVAQANALFDAGDRGAALSLLEEGMAHLVDQTELHDLHERLTQTD